MQFRARIHIFGNASSPAVADFCLRYAAEDHGPEPTEDIAEPDLAADYMRSAFYVDDGLGCAATPQEDVDTLKGARALLGKYKVRLHKIVANSPKVLAAFPASELAEDLLEVDLEDAPQQRTLGVTWDVARDCFLVKISPSPRPFTKRGILGVVNSVYDPLGFVAPVVLAAASSNGPSSPTRPTPDGTTLSRTASAPTGTHGKESCRLLTASRSPGAWWTPTTPSSSSMSSLTPARRHWESPCTVAPSPRTTM